MNRGIIRNLKLAGVWILYPMFVFFIYVITWLDRKIKFPLPFPRDIDQLAKKQQWCIKTLKKEGVLPQDSEVLNFSVKPIQQEYIFRSNAGFIEIIYKDEGRQKRLKCFAKFAPTMGTVWNRTIFNIQMNHIKEGTFNRHYVNNTACVPSPKSYCSKVDLFTGNLCLITESMDDCKEYAEGIKDTFPQEDLEIVLDGMASLHACFWRKPKRMSKVIPIMRSTVDLFDSMVAFKWSLPARKILVQSWILMNDHETVIHGDARIGNMMLPSNEHKGRFVFIDWQAARKGKAAFDLAYFLVLSLPPHLLKTLEKQAIDIYYDKLTAKGVRNYSRNDLEDDYRHACLCVLVLLSLPMLSGEASTEDAGALIFAYGMNIWREYLEVKFSEFDYQWLADHYNLSEQEGKDAVAEMLKVIKDRLAGINKKYGHYIDQTPLSKDA